MKTIQFPLIRITLAMISGIALSRFVNLSNLVLCLCVAISAVCLFTLYWFTRKQIHSQPWFGCITLILFIELGLGLVRIHDSVQNPSHFIHCIKNSQQVKSVFQIDSPLKSSAKNYRYVASIHSINGLALSGKVVVSLPKKNPKPQVGDLVASIGWLKITSPNVNPGEFDFSKYLENKHIYGRLFVKKNKLIATNNRSIRGYAYRIQQQIAVNLAQHLGKKEQPIVMALILGQQNDIDTATNSDYQLAGAIHILSVSGLHVGFLVVLLQFIFRFFPNTKPYRLTKLLLTLLVLWGFGVIAGLAPSVLRSVTMFSFVALGNYLRRTVNIYNTLCISAFLIVLWEPNYLWDIGFQLSYCALFFIVWLQPLLLQLWSPKTKIIHYFWELTTVTIAAQVGTLPLSLFYFHQFPGLFLVTNWLILPPLGIVLFLGLLLCILAYFNLFWTPLTSSVQWSIEQMNRFIHWIAQQNEFIIQKVPMELPLMCLLYVFLFSFISRLFTPTKKIVYTIGLFVIGLQITVINRQYHNSVESFIVFNQPKNYLIAWKYNSKIDTLSGNAKSTQLFQNYLVSDSFTPEKIERMKNQRIYCNGKKIVIVDHKGYFPKQPIDYVLLIKSPKCHLEQWLENHKVKGVIADGSSSRFLKKRWKESCLKLKIPFHDTAEKGPFIL